MKTILTVSDLEAMANEGLKEIKIGADVIVTDLAREAARKLDLKLQLVAKDDEKLSSVSPQAPAAPVESSPTGAIQSTPASAAGQAPDMDPELIARIKSKIVKSVGPNVSTQTLEKIIKQVVAKLEK